MDKEAVIQLTSKLYKLSLLFPKKDPFRFKIRELGINVLRNSVFLLDKESGFSEELILETQRDLEVLNCFFEVVKTLNWVSLPKLLDVREEYIKMEKEIRKIYVENQRQLKLNNIRKEEEGYNLDKEERSVQKAEKNLPLVTKEETKEKEETEDDDSSKTPFLERKNKILEILKEKGKAQVQDFKDIFPNVSKRTLRRDFNYLISMGLVERRGEKNYTFYQLTEKGKL